MPTTHLLTLIIFVLTYAVIALGEIPWTRIDRTGAALAGAVAMVITGALTESAAEHAIDFHTIALLLGMMMSSPTCASPAHFPSSPARSSAARAPASGYSR